MAGLINFSGGLSAMGQAVSNTAGAAALEQQKADLETKQTVLANQLAGTRETALETLRQAGAEKLQSGQQQFEQGQQTRQLASSEKIAAGEQATQLKVASIEAGVQAKEVNIDSATGNAILVDKQTGKSSPITDADGKPIQIPNSAQAQLAIATINSTNEELRNVNMQRTTDVNAAKSAYDTALNMSGGNPDDPKVQKAKQDLDDVKAHYEQTINSLEDRIGQASAALYNKSAVGGPGNGTINSTPAPKPAAPKIPPPPKGYIPQ